VVRGAAAKGLEVDGDALVKKRKCRKHYGTSSIHIFEPGVHSEFESHICSFTGKKRIANCMDWMISKGQDLSTASSVHTKMSFISDWWVQQTRATTVELLACNEDLAATRDFDSVSLRL
jgi:hypothetical protein